MLIRWCTWICIYRRQVVRAGLYFNGLLCRAGARAGTSRLGPRRPDGVYPFSGVRRHTASLSEPPRPRSAKYHIYCTIAAIIPRNTFSPIEKKCTQHSRPRAVPRKLNGAPIFSINICSTLTIDVYQPEPYWESGAHFICLIGQVNG